MTKAGVRTGELIAGGGALGLFVVLFLDWFRLQSSLEFALRHPGPHTTGWGSLGWLMIVLLVLSMASAFALVLLSAIARPVNQPVAAAVLTFVLGSIAAPILLVRVILQPGLGIGAGNGVVGTCAAAWVGVVFAFAIALGGWLALADERLDAAGSAYAPPPARPAPPVV
jgi:hypothetical protein